MPRSANCRNEINKNKFTHTYLMTTVIAVAEFLVFYVKGIHTA